MKRFWLVLLSLGLIMAFSASAFAVDVKFSGSYYAAGMYMNRPTLDGSAIQDGASSAFYFQRLRMQTDFVVSPGLTLITRFDALERVWGATRTASPAAPVTTQANSFGTVAENENIAFDYAYVKYDTPYGSFRAGAMPGGTWGTVFGDTSDPRWRLYYMSPSLSGLQILAIVEKNAESTYGSTSTVADDDMDTYYLAGIYTSKMFTAGLLYVYRTVANTRATAVNGPKSKFHFIYPYAIANLGPLKVQAEVNYHFGKTEYDTAGVADVDLDALAAWVDATATFGPVYVGATFAYVSGDDPNTTDDEDYSTGGLDYSPTLIMWNEDRARWFGAVSSGAAGAARGFGTTGLANAYFYQLRAGVKPTEKLDVCLAVSFMQADQTAAVGANVDDNMGYEIDLTGTYKITNNLSYMLGFGYLITGDYFKGANQATEVENDYMVINKLTVTF